MDKEVDIAIVALLFFTICLGIATAYLLFG
jgi:hypothetical protein